MEKRISHKSNKKLTKKLTISKNISEYKPLSIAVKNGKYHGCFNVYEDRTEPLIKKGEKCYLTANDPFWKNIKDVDFKVETRSQKDKNPIVKREYIIKYLTFPLKNKKYHSMKIFTICITAACWSKKMGPEQ